MIDSPNGKEPEHVEKAETNGVKKAPSNSPPSSQNQLRSSISGMRKKISEIFETARNNNAA